MFHILGFIFFFILIILVIGLAILSKVIRTVLGVGHRMKGDESTRYNRSGSASQDFAQSQNTTHENTRSNTLRREEEKARYLMKTKENT